MNWKYLAGVVCATPALFGCAAHLGALALGTHHGLSFIPTAMQRDGGGAGYHVCQSLIAVGTGGVAAAATWRACRNSSFLPEAHTDFIFANIAEEMGFIGAIAIVLLFAAFALRGLRIAFHVQETIRPASPPSASPWLWISAGLTSTSA